MTAKTASPTGETLRQRLYLHPGQLYASAEPTLVTTILGSCVAVCFWDPARRIGGLNHFVLPHWVGSGLASPRFGNVAVGSLIEQLAHLGSPAERLKAKLFGGANVLGFGAGKAHLGGKNVVLARHLLKELGIPVVAEDVGGHRGRKLIYHTDCGDAWVKGL